MSEENKNVSSPAEQDNIQIINEKLNSAAKTLTDANAEAKARLAEEKRQKADEERRERLRRDEDERLRREEERRTRELQAKKEAELAYAETYRKRLREERERAALNAAKQKALRKKEDERKRALEEAELERASRLRKGLEEAERRNAESDTLVDMASTKARENERAAAELNARRAELKEEVRKNYGTWEQLSSEQMLSSLEAKLKGTSTSKSSAEEDTAKPSPAPSANGKFVLTLDEECTDNKKADERKSTDDFVITVGGEEFDGSTDYFHTSDSLLTKAARQSADAEGASDVSAEYLFGSTLDMMTKRSDYSADYEKRRQSAEEIIRTASSAGFADGVFQPDELPTDEYVLSREGQKTADIRKKLEKQEQKALKKEEKTAKIKSRYADMLAEEQKSSPEEVSISVIAPTQESEKEADTSVFANYDEDEARIAALKEEKANLERRMLEMETSNRVEIALLNEKESSARRELIKAEFSAKEAAYLQEIDSLNAKLYEMEKFHAEQKREIENFIAGYESSRQELAVSSASASPDLEKQYGDEWLIADYDRYNKDRLDKAAMRDDRKRFADVGDDELLMQGYDRSKRYDGSQGTLSGADYARDYGEEALIKGYDKRNEGAFSKNPSDGAESERDVFASEMKLAEGERNEKVMRKKDLRRLLNKSARREEKLIRTERKKRAKQERAKDGSAIILLTECIELERKLLESYISDLRYAVAADSKKHKKRYAKKIDALTDEFNADLEVWRSKTGTEVDFISTSIPDDIIACRAIPQIAEVYYSDTDAKKKKSRLSRSDIEQMREEQLLLIKEEARRERAGKKRAERESGIVPGRNIPVTKSQMDTDLAIVSKRITYRENRYHYVVAKSRFHFGNETGKEKKARKKALAKLRKIRAARNQVIRDTKRNNARYYEIAMQDTETVKARFKADRSKMKDLAARMRALLHERDEINERLSALYSDESDGKAAKPKRSKTAELKLKETKRAFKRQLGLYKQVSRYRIPLKKKQKIYDLMNRKVELSAYLAELKYRIRHEGKRTDAYGELKNEIKDTARQLKYTERDILSLSKKLAKSAARSTGAGARIFRLALLILIVGGLVGYFFFKEQLWALLNLIISRITGLFA